MLPEMVQTEVLHLIDSPDALKKKVIEAMDVLSNIGTSGLEKNLFRNHPVSLQGTESRSPPHAFASEPLKHVSAAGVQKYTGSMLSSVGEITASITSGSVQPASLDIVETNESSTAASSLPNHDTNFVKSISPSGPGATTRKSAAQFERQNSATS